MEGRSSGKHCHSEPLFKVEILFSQLLRGLVTVVLAFSSTMLSVPLRVSTNLPMDAGQDKLF